MKRLLYSAGILTLIFVPAFAAKSSQSVSLPEAVTGAGSNVQVTLIQEDNFAAQSADVLRNARELRKLEKAFLGK
jgi:hypothetical protein